MSSHVRERDRLTFARFFRDVALGLALLGVCFSADAVEARTYPYALVDEQYSPYWLNDRTILFMGYRAGDGSLSQRKGTTLRPLRTIYVLDTQTGRLEAHADTDGIFFCYSNGVILYQKDGAVRFGQFGSEQTNTEIQENIKGGIRSNTRCHYPTPPTDPRKGGAMVPLLEEHGFVELRPANEHDKAPYCVLNCEIFLWSAGSKEPTKIERFTTRNAQNLLYGGRPLFQTYKGAYFNHGWTTIPSTERNAHARPMAWWLFPNGTTETIDLPDWEWANRKYGGYHYFPFRDGIVISDNRPNWQIHLFSLSQDRKSYSHETAFRRVTWRQTISPNGCQLAVVTGATSIPNDNPSHIEVLELCK